MRDTLRATDKRVSELDSKAAEQFDATILHNRVYEAIGQDDEVRQLVDVAERAYRLEEDKEYVRRVRRAAFGAAEQLNEQIDFVVDAAVAAECATVIKDARTDWFDGHVDDDEVEAAVEEAKAWLAEHGDAASDAGVDMEAVVWGDDSDNQEVTADV